MCGPIAMMLPVDHQNPMKKAFQISLYHVGRLLAYGTLGLLFGFLGKGLFLAGMQQQLSIIVGLMMIVFILTPEKLFAKYNFSKPIYKIISQVKSSLGKQFKSKTPDAFLTIGLLNGFLPCGMVYAALFGAIAMQNEWLGVSYMLLYGFGTIPLMTIAVYASQWVSMPFRQKIQKTIPVLVILMGTLFIFRGLGLDIPFISPSNMNLMVTAQPDCVFP
jgi:sulfite exporter TauE/SafE